MLFEKRMNKAMSEPNSKRIIQLDGLRGIAVLFVVFFHYFNNAYANTAKTSLNAFETIIQKITYWGWAGVDLFFILSGFLIASILLQNRGSKTYFSTFYIRRFSRIVPVYYLLLLLFVIAQQVFSDTPTKLFARPFHIGWYIGFLQNLQMSMEGYFGAYALAPTWSLAVEEQFYLVIPWIIYFLKDKRVLVFCLLCILLAPVYRAFSDNWYRSYTHLFARIDAPCYGVLLALLSKNNDWIIWLKKYWWALTGLLMAVLFSFVFLHVKALNHSIISLVFMSLVFVALRLNHKQMMYRFLTIPFLLKMGKYSYFIYLYHLVINGILFICFSKHINPNLGEFQGYLVTTCSFLLTWFLAAVSFAYFEGRIIQWSHRFPYK